MNANLFKTKSNQILPKQKNILLNLQTQNATGVSELLYLNY
jgi:hypothetical protein